MKIDRYTSGVMLGFSSGILARGGAIVTQIIAVPIALSHLGHARFGVYLMLAGILNWILLAASGLSSVLAKTIAGRDPRSDELRGLLGSALAFVAAVGAVLCLIVSIGFAIWAKTTTALPPALRDETLIAGLMMSVTLLFIVVLQVFEGVQNGQLKSYVGNLCRLVGTLASFAMLFLVPKWWPNIGAFVLAINGGLLISAALNALAVSRSVRPRFDHLRQGVHQIADFVKGGAPYLFVSIAGIFQTYLPVFLLGALRGPAATVDFGLFVRGLVLILSVSMMVTGPFWPALLAAESKGEGAKARRLALPVGAVVIGMGLVGGLGTALFGGEILKLWTNDAYNGGPTLKWAFGLYIFVVLWGQFWGVMLYGQGREKLVATVRFLEGLLLAIAGVVGGLLGGPGGMAIGMSLATIGLSAWIFPAAVIIRFREEDRGRAEASLKPIA